MVKQKIGHVAVLDKIDGKFEVKEYPVPKPGPGQMVIKMARCGICGTDIHMFHGHMPGIVYPIVLGHEFCGWVEELGEGVTQDYVGKPLKKGDLVIVPPGVTDYHDFFSVVAHTATTSTSTFAYGQSDPFRRRLRRICFFA
jgi:D-arabinose 1-dehydrogenase-like Zn-dependent alcohol dehydrogenase